MYNVDIIHLLLQQLGLGTRQYSIGRAHLTCIAIYCYFFLTISDAYEGSHTPEIQKGSAGEN